MTALKTVDFRSVSLPWLIDFRDRVLNEEVAPRLNLVVAATTIDALSAKAGDTLILKSGDLWSQEKVICTTLSGKQRECEVLSCDILFKDRQDWTTEDVSEYIIKPKCFAQKCTFFDLVDPCYVSEKEYAGIFLSQARMYSSFSNMVSALEHFCQVSNKDVEDQFVWLDIFCLKLTSNFYEPASCREGEVLLVKELCHAVTRFEDVVMVMEQWDYPCALRRAWCLWEIFCVAKANKQIKVALPQGEHERYMAAVVDDYDSVLASITEVDMGIAECHCQKDVFMMQEALRSVSSLEELNELVRSQLLLWVASAGTLEMENELAKGRNADSEKISNLTYVVGNIYQAHGMHQEALKVWKPMLQIDRRMASDHASKRNLALSLSSVALVLKDLERYDESLPLYHELLELNIHIYGGKDHKEIATTLSNVGDLYFSMGRYEEAKKIYQENLSLVRRLFSYNDHEVALVLNKLALVYSRMEKLEDAVPLYRNALTIMENEYSRAYIDVMQCVIKHRKQNAQLGAEPATLQNHVTAVAQ